jgi:glycosyltransferase involved in cell wall biosynthesis
LSNNKKIILIGPAYPYRGGNSLFITQTYDVLKNNFEVKIYNYKLLYPSLLFPGTTQFDKSEKQIFKVPSERVINSISPTNWLSVARKLKKENADLVVFDWWHPFFGLCHGVISSLIKKAYANQILFITENVISHEANKLDKILTKIGLKNASMFLTLSKSVEEELKRFADDRTIYRSELPRYDYYQTNSNVNISSFKDELGISEDDNVLLFFGYIRKYKGLDILLKAFPKILEKYPSSFLLVVGEFYDNPSLYMKLIDELEIGNKVKVINKFIPNEEISKYYQVTDVVILPYLSATQSAILNVTYSFKKPVIVTNVGGLSEFVEEGKTGVIVKPNSVDDIVRGYDEYLVLKESVDFTLNIEEHTSKNSFEKLPQLFEEMIENSYK